MADRVFLEGEYKRVVDDRFRISVPDELAKAVTDAEGNSVLVKERYGCLSLWSAKEWASLFQKRIDLIRFKVAEGHYEASNDWDEVQQYGRLFSTRKVAVKLAGRSRLVIPEGFREFLDVAAEGEVMIVGAAFCVEIWNPKAWLEMLRQDMPGFSPMLKRLS